MIKDTLQELAPFSIICASIADNILSFIWNLIYSDMYSWNHFLIPIPLTMLTIYKGYKIIKKTYNHYPPYGDRIIKQQRKQKIRAKTNELYRIALCLAAFYIFKEMYNKPAGWHTYSFFPWFFILLQGGLTYWIQEKRNNNYADIRDGKVEKIKNIKEYFCIAKQKSQDNQKQTSPPFEEVPSSINS